jgi:hypothetical protein
MGGIKVCDLFQNIVGGNVSDSEMGGERPFSRIFGDLFIFCGRQLLLLPYMTLAGWCTGSLVVRTLSRDYIRALHDSSCSIQQAFLPPATFQLAEFVYCDNISFKVRGQNMSVRPLGPAGYTTRSAVG